MIMTDEAPWVRPSELLEQLRRTSAQKRSSNRQRVSARMAGRILRGEWFQLQTLARRADRAMRTFAARNTATSAHATVSAMKSNGRSARHDKSVLLTSLESRPGWTRRSAHEFVHTFGSRQAEVTMPWRLEAPVLAALITRAEINTILGDTEWTLLSELQALAARELQQLCGASSEGFRWSATR